MFLFYGAIIQPVEDTVEIICRKNIYATNKKHLHYNRYVHARYVDVCLKDNKYD